MPPDATAGIRTLSTAECWDRLAAHPARVGRLGLGGPSPDILPVNYALDGRSVVFRTAEGKKLAGVDRLERVVFEVDDLDPAAGRGWSVVLRGFAEHVDDPEEVARLGALGLDPWDPSPKPAFVRIRTRLVSGREVG